MIWGFDMRSRGQTWALLGIAAAVAATLVAPARGALTLVEAESSDASLTWTGTGWEVRAAETDETTDIVPYSEMPQVHGGQIRRSATAGDTVTLSFTGVSVSVIFLTKMSNGIVNVKIDGADYADISLYNNTYAVPPAWQMYFGACSREVLIADDLAPGAHTLSLTVSGTKQFDWDPTGANVDIDAFRYGDFPFATVWGVVTDRDGDAVHREIDPNARATAAPAKVELVGAQDYTVYISDDGTYRLSGVAAGTYDLTCSGPGYASRTGSSVTVAAGSEVRHDFQLGFADGHYLFNRIHHPRRGTPVLALPGDSFAFEVNAASGATGWSASLHTAYNTYALTITGSSYDQVAGWTHTAQIPGTVPAELYDLSVTSSGGSDTSPHAVKVYGEYKTTYYFIHHTDSQNGTDWTDMETVVPEVNLINPEFIINTGDNIAGPWRPGGVTTPSEWDWRRWNDWEARWDMHTVPVFSVPGNHCVGGGLVLHADHYKKRVGRRYNAETYGAYLILTLDNTIFNQCNGYTYDHCGYYDAREKWVIDVLTNSPGMTMTFLGIHVGRDDFTDLTNNNWYDEMRARGTNGNWIDTYGVDMAFYGHWGQDWLANIGPNSMYYYQTRDMPAYRLVRIDGSTVVSHDYGGGGTSITAGSLTMSYASANDGTQTANTATIVNGLAEHFEYGRVKFVMQKGTYVATSSPAGAAVTQTIDSDDGNYTVVYVGYDIPASATSTVTVEPGANVAPTVDAGADAVVVWPDDTTTLDGTVTDPGDAPVTLWTVQSGPAGVAFADDAAVDTTATFPGLGTYVLMLEADDGVNPAVSDTVTVDVVARELTVTAPTGGSFVGKQDVTVTWTSNFATDVAVAFSDDGWSTSTVVAASTANDGSLTWELPNTTSATCALRVSDLDGDPTDDSAVFGVTAIVDADGDRLDDGWEATYWGDTTTTAGGATDSDGDGASDLEEFWNGSDPPGAGGVSGGGGGVSCIAGGAGGAAVLLVIGMLALARRVERT